MSASIEAVNLAAPYARLTVPDAAAEVAAALRSIDATYSPQSLQVSLPSVQSCAQTSRAAVPMPWVVGMAWTRKSMANSSKHAWQACVSDGMPWKFESSM